MRHGNGKLREEAEVDDVSETGTALQLGLPRGDNVNRHARVHAFTPSAFAEHLGRSPVLEARLLEQLRVLGATHPQALPALLTGVPQSWQGAQCKQGRDM